MTEAEKITMVKTMSGESDTEVVSTYLSVAGQKILRIAYPFDGTMREVPDKYALTQVDAAVYLLNKRGAEGQTSHSENGISRNYENADLPASLLRDIVPVCGVI